MTLESTQPLTEMSTRGISWGLRRQVRRADNLAICMCRLSRHSGSLNLLKPEGLFQASIGITLSSIGITVYTTLVIYLVL
jgi:hypothetical protein